MNNIFKESSDKLLLLGKRLGLLLVTYTIMRVMFFAFNYGSFSDVPFQSVLLAHLTGLRFDLSIISLVNIPFIFFSLLPFQFVKFPAYQKGLKWLFFLVNMPLVFLNLIDIEFYKFTGKRTTYDILGIKGDVMDQSVQLASYYWYFILGFIIICFLIWKLYPSMKNTISVKIKGYKRFQTLVVFTVTALAVLVFRGGFQLRPLRPNDAFIFSPAKVGNIVLNTPFSFLTTIDIQPISKVTFFEKKKEIVALIGKIFPGEEKPAVKENIVILICESFATEYMGLENEKSYTPFMDSLAKEGIYMVNHFANGRRSVEALPSILASIPSLMDEPYITSIYQTNEVIGLGTILRDHGYHTSFFHGGKNGTMSFDAFSRNAGFLEYYGLDEYPDKKDFDGKWGIFDEPYLQYCSNMLSRFKQPFATSIFTLSSHHPFTIPQKYQGKFPKGDLEIHESIGYADYSLRKFFEAASKTDWYKNTLFIITADHTSLSGNPIYQTQTGGFDVPLILFHPGKKISVPDSERITQHADIMPSVLDYLNIPNPNPVFFGSSVFSDKQEGYALIYSNNNYSLITREGIVNLSPDATTSLISLNPEKESELAGKKEIYEKKLKAYVQYFNNGLIENNWYKYLQSQE
ncbi:MAG: LTA synthase family protein [Cytophagaceae bacterium]